MAKELARSIGACGRSKAYHKRGVWAVKAKNGGKLPVHPKKPVVKHAAAKRNGRFYAPEDVPKPLPKRVVHKPTKLRCVLLPLDGNDSRARTAACGRDGTAQPRWKGTKPWTDGNDADGSTRAIGIDVDVERRRTYHETGPPSRQEPCSSSLQDDSRENASCS